MVVTVWFVRQCNMVPAGTENDPVLTNVSADARGMATAASKTARRTRLTMEYLLQGFMAGPWRFVQLWIDAVILQR
jgi:hypothetical protein